MNALAATHHDPFHAGERALQQSVGLRERMASVGARVIRDFMPEQHREFFAQLPFLIVGSTDDTWQPWASVLHGRAGFAHSPDPRHLRIDALPPRGSPLQASLRPDAPIGLLGIEPHTRRRNRLNGRVAALDATGFDLEVEQSFGNCPQYIHRRVPVVTRQGTIEVERLPSLDAAAHVLIANADTLFIASAHDGAVDVSHRGGEPGFVDVDAAGRLLLPDYRGNFFFNTLGNLLMNPRAGLLFVDFDGGDLLQIAAKAEVLLEGPEVEARPEAERLVRLEVTSALRTKRGLPLRWE
jgi:uncharacterized protein